ncbi:hypothetical protein [Sessilibacter corallicola]|nr:hypothetical protein [Sessilibacter corallicola]
MPYQKPAYATPPWQRTAGKSLINLVNLWLSRTRGDGRPSP